MCCEVCTLIVVFGSRAWWCCISGVVVKNLDELELVELLDSSSSDFATLAV